MPARARVRTICSRPPVRSCRTPGVTLDYADLVDPDTFEALDEAAPASPEDGSAEPAPPREAVYVVAAVVDGVRLLDTTALRIEGARALGSMPG